MKPAAILCLAVAALIAAPAGSQDGKPVDLSDPISVRQHMMKTVGGAMKLAVPMIKGETEFEPRVALGAFTIMNAAALGFASQFPAGTETGGETEASPKIWSDAPGFQTAVAKFVTDTEMAVAAAPADMEAFKASFGAVTANCKACHEAYRIKKN